jgi:AcrR family transcriptional regulator
MVGVTQAFEQDGEQAPRKSESLAKLKLTARKLFVERGYHATRPQDIAREAGLGHGTFYLHFADKRACFLAFVDEAREELDVYVRLRRVPGATLEEHIGAAIGAIYDYSETHPGVLRAAMTDESVIAAEDVEAVPLLMRWGQEWAAALRQTADHGLTCDSYDAGIIGQAIVGAIHQVSRAGAQGRIRREALVENLTRFLARALKPGS